MTIENLSDEELNEALKSELSQTDEGINESENVEDETEQESQDEETETSKEETETEQEQPKPKAKSNVPKLLQERNEMRRRIQELESQVWTDKDIDLEYINMKAQQIASETYYRNEFFKNTPWAYDVKDEIETLMQEHNLDIDRAYKLYLIEQDPEELKILNNKKNAKKFDVSAYPNKQNRVEKPVAQMTSEELKKQLFADMKAGKVTF